MHETIFTLLIVGAVIVISFLLILLILWVNNVLAFPEKRYDIVPAGTNQSDEIRYICISLPNRRKKFENLKSQLEKCNITNLDVFDAINGKELNLDLLGPDVITSRYKEHFRRNTKHRGHLGAAFSHVAVLRLMIEQGWKRTVVFEDDVVVNSDFQVELFDSLQRLDIQDPEWDMFQLGFSCSYDSYDKCHRNDNLPFIDGEKIIKLGYGIGLFGYVINGPRAAAKILKDMFPISWHIDHFIQDLHYKKKISIYGAIPNIVFHPGTFEISSFNERYVKTAKGYRSDTNH